MKPGKLNMNYYYLVNFKRTNMGNYVEYDFLKKLAAERRIAFADEDEEKIGRLRHLENIIRSLRNRIKVSKAELNSLYLKDRSGDGWSVDLLKQKDGRRINLSYADHDFSINNMPLNELEVNQMQSAFNILSQFKGLPQFEWMQELLPKISQGMAVNKSQHTIMSFGNNQDLKGIEHLGTLYNAIHYKEPLLITYRHFLQRLLKI